MVAAVIVLYNPDLPLLDRLLRSVIGQVAKLYIVDNTPRSSDKFSAYFDKYQSWISYLPLGENKGIATAQNVAIHKCIDGGCSHVLLLDQDSALPPDMVDKLLNAEQELLDRREEVAAVGPAFVDDKTGNYPRAIGRIMRRRRMASDESLSKPIPTSWIMASGSLIRCTVLSEVGIMLDELFIDGVDTEWGLRALKKGYRSYIIPTALLRHSTGDTAIRLFGREIYLHNDLRHYYIVRNAAYLLRLNSMGWRWRTKVIAKIPSYILVYSAYSDHRLKSLLALLDAIVHGLRGRLGRLN